MTEDSGYVIDELFDAASAYLDSVAPQGSTTHFLAGASEEALQDFAAKKAAGLIVMTLSGRGGADGRTPGSVTDRLVGEATPVLVVGGAYQERSPGRTPPARGFYNGRTGQLHIAPGGARARIVVHEAVHLLARDLNPDGGQLLGGFLDEGITDMITVSRLGRDAIPQSYQPNIEFAEFLSSKLGMYGPIDKGQRPTRPQPVPRIRQALMPGIVLQPLP